MIALIGAVNTKHRMFVQKQSPKYLKVILEKSRLGYLSHLGHEYVCLTYRLLIDALMCCIAMCGAS